MPHTAPCPSCLQCKGGWCRLGLTPCTMRALSGHRPQPENQKMFLPGADGVDESPDIIRDQCVSANQLKIGLDRDSGIYTSTWLIVGGHFNYSGSPLIK